MKTKIFAKTRPDILAAAMLISSMWSSPASAGLIGDIICGIFGCGGGGSGGGGSGGGGSGGAPEIDAGAGLAAMALVAGVSAVVYRKIRS